MHNIWFILIIWVDYIVHFIFVKLVITTRKQIYILMLKSYIYFNTLAI